MTLLIHRPSAFRDEAIRHEVEPGRTIAEMVAEADVPLPPPGFDVVAVVGDRIVERRDWLDVVPPPSTAVVVQVRLEGGGGGGGGGKAVLQVVATIAILSVAGVAGGVVAGAIGGTAGSIAGTVATGFLGSAGFLALNSLVKPPKRPAIAAPGPSYSITGVRNQANPWGVIPFVAGRVRIYPVIGGAPWTEVRGKDQWMYVLLVVGHGPISIEDILVGDTPIDDLPAGSIEWESRPGYPGDPPITLYPETVIEDRPNATLGFYEAGAHVGTIGTDVDELAVDVWFPDGLWAYRDHAQKDNHVVYDVQYRVVGATPWTTMAHVDIKDTLVQPFRRSHRANVARNDYEVRVVKRKGTNDSRYHETIVVTAVRGIKHEPPLKKSGLAQMAFRIKADENMNGVIDKISVMAHSILPDWDSASGTWIERKTRNPAAIYRAILQGPANHHPVPGSKIAFVDPAHGLQPWSEYCEQESFWYDNIFDTPGTVYERLQSVAVGGRASYGRYNNNHAIVRDRAQGTAVQHITPSNSWGMKGSVNYDPLPRALRASFHNRLGDWQVEERLVFADGWNEANTPLDRYEKLDLTDSGVTTPDLAWRHGRFYLALAEYRRETWSVEMDVEHLVATRGDMVDFSHAAALVGLASGLVVSADSSGITLDRDVELEAGQSYRIRWRVDDATVSRDLDVPGGGYVGRDVVFNSAAGAGEVPSRGDMWHLGHPSLTAQRCMIVDVRHSARDLTARLKLQPYTPVIYDADAGAVPPYVPKVTQPTEYHLRRPGVPQILLVRKVQVYEPNRPDAFMKVQLLIGIEPPSLRSPPPRTYRYRVRKAGTTDWPITGVVEATNEHEVLTQLVQVGFRYEVQVRAQTFNNESEWSEIVSVDARIAEDTVADVARVTGLQLVGKGNDQTFEGRSARLTWRLTSPSAPNAFDRPAVGRGGLEASFSHYRVQVLDPNRANQRRRDEAITTPPWDYTYDENSQDSARLGLEEPIREFTVVVRAVDKYGREGAPAKITVSNPAPPAPTGLNLTGNVGSVFFSVDDPKDADYRKTRVWASKTSPVLLTQDNLKSDGAITFGTFAVDAGATYNVVIAHADAFSDDPLLLNPSSEVQVQSLTIDPGSVVKFDFGPVPVFSGQVSPNQLEWTESVAHVTSGGAVTSYNVGAGALNYPGQTTYLYYIQGGGALQNTTDIVQATGVDRIIVAVWRGGRDVASSPGEVLIDGTDIYAGTIGSQQLVTGQAVITGGAQIASAIIDNGHIANLSADKLIAESILSERIYLGDSNFILDGRPATGFTPTMLVRNAGTDRVRVGRMPNGEYGIRIFDQAGSTMMESVGNSTFMNGARILDLSVDTISIKDRAITESSFAIATGQLVFFLNNPEPNFSGRFDDLIDVSLFVDVGSGVGAFVHAVVSYEYTTEEQAKIQSTLRMKRGTTTIATMTQTTTASGGSTLVYRATHHQGDRPAGSGVQQYRVQLETSWSDPGTNLECRINRCDLMVMSAKK